MGERLRVLLPRGARGFTVRYRTAPDASALQWLLPEQTAGRKHPFLFSQCQAIHARSLVPLQDTPRARITYQATLHLPRELSSRMAARSLGRQSSRHGRSWAADSFEMPQPIPALPARARGRRAGRARARRPRVGRRRAVAAGRRRQRVRGDPQDDRRGGIALRPLRLGALRRAGHAAVVSLRRDGKSAPHLPHALGDRGRSLAGQRGRARAGARLDGQPRHQRRRQPLLAKRGLHRLRRAPNPRGARGPRGLRAARRHRPPRSRRGAREVRRDARR